MGFFNKLKNKAKSVANDAVRSQVQSPVSAETAADEDYDVDDDDDDDDEGYSVVNSDWYEKNMAAGNINHFGQLDPNDLSKFWYVYFELEEAEQNEALEPKFAEFGISGKEEWGQIWASFMARHFSGMSEQQAQETFLRAMMEARNKQLTEKMQGAQAADPSLTAPVEGVTVEGWAQAAATLAQNQDIAAQEQALAGLGMDRAKYERVNAEFQARMQGDTSFVIANIYGKAFSGAVGVQGGFSRDSSELGAEPCTFEQYAEIMAAQSAWANQGHDVNAMLQQTFGIDALGWSKYSGYWATKFATDPVLALKHADLVEKYEAKYGGGGMDDDLSV